MSEGRQEGAAGDGQADQVVHDDGWVVGSVGMIAKNGVVCRMIVNLIDWTLMNANISPRLDELPMKARFRHLWMVALIFTFANNGWAASLLKQEIDKAGLSREQASEVLLLVLRHQKIPQPPASTIEYLTKKDGGDLAADYFAFGVTADSANNGASTVYGMFAVNRQTGDVWEWNLCKRYRFARLTQLQKVVMQKTGKRLAAASIVKASLGCG